MIQLPAVARTQSAEPYVVDFGFWLTPPTGAESTRVDRKGGRFGANILLAPISAEDAKAVVSRLIAAYFGDTLRVKYPLMGVSQAGAGSPQVNGAGQAGKTLLIKGLTPGYQIKEGFWLTVYDANGRGYLHNARSAATASAGGLASISVESELRWPFANSAAIEINEPTIEGRVAAQPWQLPRGRLVQVGFTIEENA